METTVLQGIRYVVEAQSEGAPKLTPLTDYIKDGDIVLAGTDKVTLVHRFTHKDVLVAVVEHDRKRMPLTVVEFDALRPVA